MATTLQTLAMQASASASAAAFRLRARDLGGVNDHTREDIERTARKAGRYAYIGVYLDHGYRLCGCHALVNPRFNRCFVCGAAKHGLVKKAQPEQLTLADRMDAQMSANAEDGTLTSMTPAEAEFMYFGWLVAN